MKTTKYLALVLATLLIAGCSGKKEEKKDPNADLPLVAVQSVFVQEVPQTSEYTATVEAFKTNNIMSNSGARIKRILVDVGSHVRAGQSVVILDDVNITTQNAAIAQQQIQIANQKRDLERAKELVRIGGGTQQTVDQMQAQYDAQIRALEASNRQLRNLRENTVLTSPVSGVVTAKNYDAGDLPAGLPVLTIEQQQPLKVVVNVNESEFPQVKVAKRSIVVPDLAIQKQTGSGVRFVYVYNTDGTVSFREVKLGRRMTDRYEVLSGIDNGMQVVVKGQSRLADGVKVALQK